MAMTFEDVQKQAKSEWDSLYHGSSPIILVGSATCGRAAGSLQVLDAFSRKLKEANSDARVFEVGCMGLCLLEPLVTIIKPGLFNICYHKVTPHIVPAMVERCILNDDLCMEYALGTV